VDRHIFQACPVWIYTLSTLLHIHLSTLHQHRKNMNIIYVLINSTQRVKQ
jgi:hypothetical protein